MPAPAVILLAYTSTWCKVFISEYDKFGRIVILLKRANKLILFV